MAAFSLTDNFLCFQRVCDLEKGLGGYMLTGKSGQLVSWALEGREQTLQVPLCLWGELWGNG